MASVSPWVSRLPRSTRSFSPASSTDARAAASSRSRASNDAARSSSCPPARVETGLDAVELPAPLVERSGAGGQLRLAGGERVAALGQLPLDLGPDARRRLVADHEPLGFLRKLHTLRVELCAHVLEVLLALGDRPRALLHLGHQAQPGRLVLLGGLLALVQ